jgi:formylglycine-generating enzyme required for sulfatase activity
MKTNIISAALFAAITSPAFGVVIIDWVTIGDPGNAAQSAANRTHSEFGGDGRGSVSYTYRMSRNETTIAQYAEFLNAKAATDPYGLYNTNMASNANIAGIQRSGTAGSYTYSVVGSGERPITYVSWFDAARFSNWMHNGQGNGDTENGAYLISGSIAYINSGATVYLPTIEEWYKAAYYDPTHMNGAGGYWLHANQSDSMTNNSALVAGAANYRDGDYAVTQSVSYSASQNYLTDVGSYGVDSRNYYGINDMAGNVWEWQHGANNPTFLRGGSWNTFETLLRSSEYFFITDNAFLETSDFGFRLAAIPEPSSALLTVLSAAALLRRRR